MAHTGQWKVDVFLFEGDSEVTAEAVLKADTARPVVGRGKARLGRVATAPEIGVELATSRALAALGHRLVELSSPARQTDDGHGGDHEPATQGRRRRAGDAR